MPVLNGLTIDQHDHAPGITITITITLAGELDLVGVPPVRAALEDCLRRGVRTIDIDLTDLTFCDASGLEVFLAAAERTAAAGGFLRLYHPQHLVARVLDLTGTRFLLRPPTVPFGDLAANRPDGEPARPGTVGPDLGQGTIRPSSGRPRGGGR